MTATSPPRDRDRQAVYDVEEAAFAGTVFAEPVPFHDAAALLDDFCARSWWAARLLARPTALPTRRDSLRSYAASGPAGPSVHLSPEGCSVAVVAHELAHLLVDDLGAAVDAEPAHGPAFRRAVVVLAGALMGAAARDRLAGGFLTAGLALGPEPAGIPPATGRGHWAAWRAARIRDAARRPAGGAIALPAPTSTATPS